MKGKGESMKISYNTGRRENIIGLVLWGIFIIVYCCAIYMLFRFHFYLSLRAFHAHEGAGWQDWRNRKEKTADRETSGS